MVFTPALMFASLVQTVTLEDVISWLAIFFNFFLFPFYPKQSLMPTFYTISRWFMPVNIALTFAFGGFFGWILVKILKPEPYLQGLVIAMSSSGRTFRLVSLSAIFALVDRFSQIVIQED